MVSLPRLASFLLLCAGCARPQTVSRAPLTISPSTAQAEEIVTRTNAERGRLKLPVLDRNESLMKAAQLQADQMAAIQTMAHDLPRAPYPSPDSRLEAVGYHRRASGENVAEGYSSATTVVAGWMTSPGHRENMLSTHYTEMGAGVATGANGRKYYAQVFGSR